MPLYYKDGGKISGTINDSDRFVLDVLSGIVRKTETAYQLIAKVNSFSHLQKFGDNNFKLPEGSVICLDLHDKEWTTKKWDKEKGGYTNETITHTPSIQELALLTYLHAEILIGVFFAGTIELVNGKVSKQIVEGLTGNADLIFDIKKTDVELSGDELAVGSPKSGTDRKYKSLEEIYKERFLVFKSALKGIKGIDDCETLQDVATAIINSRETEAEGAVTDLTVNLAKLFIK
jgi:hypothetical protein